MSVTRTLRLTCRKKAEYTTFLHSEKFSMNVSLKDCALFIKLFLQEQWRCTSSPEEIPGYEECEKRFWSYGCPWSVKSYSEIWKDRFFWYATGWGRKRNDSTVVEELAATLQEELSCGVKTDNSRELPEHWTGLWKQCIKFHETSCISILTNVAVYRSCIFLTCQQERDFCFRISCSHESGQRMAVKNFLNRRSPLPSDRIC